MEDLRRRLEELHAELARTERVDPGARTALEAVLRDIQTLLAESGERGPRAPAPLAERLREATGHFEETHPKLTAALGRVVDALAALGI